MFKMKRNFLNKILNLWGKSDNFNSKNYWESRYLSKGNSGSGSYGQLAAFKAEVINSFVENNNISDIVELGCGDGNQLLLAKYPTYIGFDVSESALDICNSKFKFDSSKQFYNYSDNCRKEIIADLVLSLDVLFHLIEDHVFNDYMRNLFSISSKYVIIYSCNYNKVIADHVKCRHFTSWIDKNIGNFKQICFIKNAFPFDSKLPNETSFSNFYIYQKIDD